MSSTDVVTFTARCPCGRTVTWTATRRELDRTLGDQATETPTCTCPPEHWMPAQRSA